MALELEPVGVEGEDFFVVQKEDKQLVIPIRKEGEKYHPDAQIRAYQMVQEGRIGGPGRGQGRKRQPRAAEHVAAEIRKRAGKIVRAIDNGLDAESVHTQLKAASMALEIEREETRLQLQEEKQDAELDNMSKEELVATFFQLVSDPAAEAALGVIDLPDSAVTEIPVSSDNTGYGSGEAPRAAQAPARSTTSRPKLRAFGGNGRGSAPRDGQADAGSRAEATHRRAAD
jgi:hypothetical protein